MMRATHRRAIGMTATLVVLLVYSFFAVSIGGLFADRHWAVQIGFFAFAGMAWVIPLYPVYKWMRQLDPDEAKTEKPPQAAAIRKRG